MDINTALEQLRTVIDSNVVDVWEQATGRSRDPEQRIFFNDIRLSGGIFPKIFIEVDPLENNKLNWGGGKNVHKNRESATATIYYINPAKMKYYEDNNVYENGGSNSSRDLNWFMREKIRDEIIRNAKQLEGMNNIRFGGMNSTSKNNDNFVGMLPISFNWVRTIGGT